MRLLLIHATPLARLGGAELSLRGHLAAAPPNVSVDVALPDQPVSLAQYDTLLLANLRPAGGVGERKEGQWARMWARRIKGYRGYVIRSERDIHPCTFRDGRCIRTDPLERVACNCRRRRIPRAFERLYNLCDAVQFLSPLHRRAINLLINIETPRQFEVASPINFAQFRPRIPFDQRKHAALLTGDTIRLAPEAIELARAAGYPVEQVDYLSVPHDAMPDLLNQYKAVVVAPGMLHAFGRLAVEAMACGCQVITNNRVGAMSWPDPLSASREANDLFWRMIADRPDKPNPHRMRRFGFWRL